MPDDDVMQSPAHTPLSAPTPLAKATKMSSYQRRHDPPEAFSKSVNDYYRQKKSFNDVFNTILSQQEDPQARPGSRTQEGQTVVLREKDYQHISANMPVHDAEENTSSHIFDQVAKESSSSTASDHPHHDVDTDATSGGATGKATAQDHKAAPGPVMTDNLPEKAGKDELKAKAAELNK